MSHAERVAADFLFLSELTKGRGNTRPPLFSTAVFYCFLGDWTGVFLGDATFFLMGEIGENWLLPLGDCKLLASLLSKQEVVSMWMVLRGSLLPLRGDCWAELADLVGERTGDLVMWRMQKGAPSSSTHFSSLVCKWGIWAFLERFRV